MNNRSYETLLYSITASVTNRLIEMNNWSEDEALEIYKFKIIYIFRKRRN